MFRVRFNDEHTDGYAPAQLVEKVSGQLAKLLKRQRMTFSHTDGAGFACFVPAAPKAKRQPRVRACARCGYTDTQTVEAQWRQAVVQREATA